jgi:autotransporter translocation and assembly factor TamB
MRRVLRVLGLSLTVFLVLALVGFGILTRTQAGADLALRIGLAQVNGRFDGRFAVGAIRSSGLLSGLSLYDVTISDLEGRPALSLDSVEIRYRARDLVRQRIHLRTADIWGARIDIFQMPGEERVNVERIFVPVDSRAAGDSEGGGSGLVVRLSDTRVHDARVTVRVPAGANADTTGGLFETAPDGTWLRMVELTELETQVEEAWIVGPQQEGERAELTGFSARVHLFSRPFRVEQLSGEVRRSGATASVEATLIQVESSRFGGRASVDWSGDDLAYDAELSSERFDPADFAFFEPRLPSGMGNGDLRAVGSGSRGTYSFRDGELAVGTSRMRGSITVHIDELIHLEGVDVEADRLDLNLLDPWIDPNPATGLVVGGRVRADGPLDRLRVAGRVIVEPADGSAGPSTVELTGDLGITEPFGAYGLQVDATPLSFGLVERFWPASPLEGTGSVTGTLDGRLDLGTTMDLTLSHVLSPADTSRVRYQGSVRLSPATTVLGGRLHLLGLHLPSLSRVHPALEAHEVAWGTLDLNGPLDDLGVEGDLRTSTGDVAGTLRLDAAHPGSEIRLDLRLADLDPGPFIRSDDPFLLNGRVAADVRRDALGDPTGEAAVELGASTLERWAVDTLSATVELSGGYASLQDALVELSGVRLLGNGTVALDTAHAPGSLDVQLAVRDLGRAWADLGRSPADSVDEAADSVSEAADSASPVDAQAETADSELGGRARGTLTIRGALPILDLDGSIDLLELTHPTLEADSVRLSLAARDLVRDRRKLRVDGELSALELFDRPFDEGTVELTYEANSVSFAAEVARGELQRHQVAGTLAPGDTVSELHLDALDLRVGSVSTSLVGPARFEWGEAGLTVEGLEIAESGGAGLSASGTIPREGQVDFRVRASGMNLNRLASIWMPSDSMAGTVDGELAFTGPAADPTLAASLVVQDLSIRGGLIRHVEADLEYEDRSAALRVRARSEGDPLLEADIRFPVDLSPQGGLPRVLEAPLSGSIAAREMPLEGLLWSPGVIDDVSGTVDGDLTLSGTPESPRASGALTIADASAFFPGFGVRQQARGQLSLVGDGTIDLDLAVQSVGNARITGSVGLQDLRDPIFDLQIRADSFQVLNRRDVNGQVSGEARFTGSWASPRLDGTLSIRNANLLLDELARSRQVADVSEADFYQVVDTTIFVTNIPETPSFADRSTISLDLRVGSSTWLRSRELDAQLEGRLLVTHQPGGQYSVTGELRTVRGSYRGFGRNFQVVEGSVLFASSEILDPILNIVAVARIRSSDQALDIFATLEGTASQPRVSLTSDAQQPMAQEELVSYLVFGRPSYQLGSAENAVVSGVTGAASSLALGVVANELGSALGREIGVFDYFAITAPQDVTAAGQSEVFRNSISSTQVEFGHYLSENLFLAAIFRPFDSSSQFAGARLQWRFRDRTSFEVFLEDRLARSPSATFGDLGYTLEQSLGMFLAREWTY